MRRGKSTCNINSDVNYWNFPFAFPRYFTSATNHISYNLILSLIYCHHFYNATS